VLLTLPYIFLLVRPPPKFIFPKGESEVTRVAMTKQTASRIDIVLSAKVAARVPDDFKTK
jgi:hypothetical protein